MADLADWPDVLIVVRAALLDLCPNIAPETPADPAGSLSWLPFLRIECIGGSDDGLTDTSRLTIDAFASTRSAAQALAGSVRQRFVSPGILRVSGKGVIDLAATSAKPRPIAWTASPPPFRYSASYRVDMRRLTSA